jgi:3-isopropylmalate/(R)-2-methylmalate dehydratase small subunit
MERFAPLDAVALPIAQSNVDTDQILPARFLQKLRREGFGQYLFHDLRFHSGGSANSAFILNQSPYRQARILVAEQNFGCGSSRENAVWALADYGFRLLIAPSFGDIFSNNCLKNGLLPITLPQDVVNNLITSLQAVPGQTVQADLASQTVSLPDGTHHTFAVDPFAKHCLLNGIDELDYTLSRMDEILAFEQGLTGTD